MDGESELRVVLETLSIGLIVSDERQGESFMLQ